MHLVGVHQELGPVSVDGKAEVVCDPFVHVQSRRPAESSGEIDAVLPMVHVVAHSVVSIFDHAGRCVAMWSSLKPTSQGDLILLAKTAICEGVGI